MTSASQSTRLKFSLAIGVLATTFIAAGMAIRSSYVPSPNASLSESILGQWETTSLVGFGAAGAPAYFQVDFIDASTLLIDIDAPRARWSNIQFVYKFTGPRTIHISERVADDWDLRLEDDRLIITSRQWLHEGATVSYSRVRAPNWPLVCLGLLLSAIALFAFPIPRTPSKTSISIRPAPIPTSSRDALLLIGSGVLAIVVGFLNGSYVWFWPALTFNRPPWNDFLVFLSVSWL
jgi:hypothetical protein